MGLKPLADLCFDRSTDDAGRSPQFHLSLDKYTKSRGFAMSEKAFDLVLFGATGFAGRQAAAYLKASMPQGLRWAIAGRDRGRLEALGVGVPILVADARRPAEVDAIVSATRVVATTAGPFKLYGDPLVEACVRLGAHYVDISGETARIRNLIDRHHASAKAAGVRIVNFCAVSSAPADLGVYLLNKALGGRLTEAKGFCELGGGSFSGGTIASISHAFDSGDARREKDVFLLNPDQRRPAKAIERDPTGVHFDRDIKAWTTPSPMGVSDTRAVRRSGVLTGQDVAYQEYAAFPTGYLGALSFNSIITLFGAAMSIRAVRSYLQKKLPPGSGPSEAQMDAGSYKLRIFGSSNAGDKAVVTIKGEGDAGNRITVKCFCESALALAVDEACLPADFGVITPSVAFGDVLPARLQRAGIDIDIRSL